MNAETLSARKRDKAAAVVLAAAPRQYLSFTLGEELFAVPIAPIREIIEFAGLTEIPLTPPFMRGVINLRGAVVPVIDLSVRFERERTQIGRRSCVVIVEVALEDGMHPLGVIVDAVNEVLEVEPDRIEPRPGFGAGLRDDFVAGMLSLDGRFVVVLDLECVLSPAELEQLVGACAAN
jgi:purine-binding chemotaxis protein CheW